MKSDNRNFTEQDDFKARISQAVEMLCKQHNLTKGEIARSVGVSSSALSNWLSGKSRTLSRPTAQLLAREYGIDPQWLQTGVGAMLLPNKKGLKTGGGITVSQAQFGYDVTGTLEGWGRLMSFLHTGAGWDQLEFKQERGRPADVRKIGLRLARSAMQQKQDRVLVPTPLRIPDGYGKHEDLILLVLSGSAPKGFLLIDPKPWRTIRHLDGTVVAEHTCRIRALFTGAWGSLGFADDIEPAVAVSPANRAYFQRLLDGVDRQPELAFAQDYYDLWHRGETLPWDAPLPGSEPE